MSADGQSRPVTYEEFVDAMNEQIANISDIMEVVNTLKNAINTQAEVLAAFQYALGTVIPPERLKTVLAEFKKERAKQVLMQTLPAANA